MNLFKTGIRPVVDDHLAKLAAQKRDYGDYWSASSAGYCMRKLIFERLNIPYTSVDARKQRVFSSGDIFHEWIQRITKDAGLSLAQELELQDEKLMVRGHIDDLILLDDKLVLYDYKSRSSKRFAYSANQPLNHYYRMQVATYLYMLRKLTDEQVYGGNSFIWEGQGGGGRAELVRSVSEARVLSISKDDLRLNEKQVLYTPALEKEVVNYWTTLNGYWQALKIPVCTCGKYENGFMAREAYNPFWYHGKPCSLEWMKLQLKQAKESQ